MPLLRALCCLSLWLGACAGPSGEPSSEAFDPREAPVQHALDAADDALRDALPELPPERLDDARIVPRARYVIAARVLGRERYYLDAHSTLSPLDLALGWGRMSDPGVDDWISWYQRGRWYFWQWRAGSPYRNEAIRTASANVHVVPATENLRRALLTLQPGDSIKLEGFLVDIESASGERWQTSLSRTDTGDRSCELLYATTLTTQGMRYR